MGYTTDFSGQIEITPPLNEQEISYLNKFSETRRMHRTNGPYFVDGNGYAGQRNDADILDRNSPDPEQPGLWCHWIPTEDGQYLEWSGAEKFYGAEEWMDYLIQHFLSEHPIAKEKKPEEFSFLQCHILNGIIEAQGEESSDHWYLNVEENIVSSFRTPNISGFDSQHSYPKNDLPLVLTKIEEAIQKDLQFVIEYSDNEVIISFSSDDDISKGNIFS